jgi:dTDP-4-amino-4,6-dideoxygalactose transaminase
VCAAYGRMAFYYMLKALDLPIGSEIIFPSLTFWVVPELAKVAGLHVVFADVDPRTFTIDPASVERLVTEDTRAIVPTHLYGLPCDMDAILDIASRHDLVVLEDCAHALGATYKGRQVGTFGTGALFSFQTLKPLNCYGGGAALLQDAALAARVRALVDALPWPNEKRVSDRLFLGRLQRIFIKPWVFSISLFPVLWVSALIDASPDVFLWEKIRSLDPLPEAYRERFPNVQAVLGLEGLTHFDRWTADARAHAEFMDRTLGALPGVRVPHVPPDSTHVYYQYCVYGPESVERDALVVRCVRRGVDIETLHVDVPPDMDLFAGARAEAVGARRASQAIQIPVYSSLTNEQAGRVASVVRDVLAHA